VSNIPSVIKNLKLRITQLEGYNAGLAAESCKQQAKIAELEKEKAEYVPVLAWIARECNQVGGGMLYRLKSYLAILKLEQQAKGLSEGFHATKEPIGRNAFGFIMHYCSENNLKDRVDDLRNQAKALKEQE
jgi:hypothetical protein